MPKFDPVDYALHYGARCRECADEDGVCPHDGTPCDPDVVRAVVRHTLDAWRYGVANGYMGSPFEDLIEEARAQARREAFEEAARLADGWVEAFGSREVQHISATKLATDAMKDVADAIRGRIDAVTPSKAARAMQQIECSVGTMKTSAGTDYFVVLKNGDREITPESHSVRGRAEYSVAQYRHFFGQLDEEPDIFDYETDDDGAKDMV
jgi:hypothetical protein